MAYQLWSSGMDAMWIYKSGGSKGGLLIMWDNKVWKGSKVEKHNFSITSRLDSVLNSFCWFFIGRSRSYKVFFFETGNIVFLSIKGYAGHLQKC